MEDSQAYYPHFFVTARAEQITRAAECYSECGTRTEGRSLMTGDFNINI